MKKTALLSIFLILLISVNLLGQNKKKATYFKDPKGYTFIPLGTYEFQGKSLSIAPFYMSKTEVTNGEYYEFLNDLRKQGRMDEYEKAKIDTSLWNKLKTKGSSSFSKDYHLKKDFPVVNVSFEGAQLYCKWLTEKYHKENKNNESVFRLPLEIEWEYAAGSDKPVKDNPFPWKGNSAKNDKGKLLACFKTEPNSLGPVKVKSYSPNEYGLYDMAGNVAEMVHKGASFKNEKVVKGGSWNSDEADLKIESQGTYGISPMIGFRPVMNYVGK